MMVRYVVASSMSWAQIGGGRPFKSLRAARKHAAYVERAAARGLVEFVTGADMTGGAKIFKMSITEVRR